MKKQPCLKLLVALGIGILAFVPVALAEDAAAPGELIFPPQSKHCHGSSLVECPNGDLLACWFFGSGERTADDVVIQGARLAKGSSDWGPVFLMADTPNYPDCNPVMFLDPKGRLRLVWITVLAKGWQHSILKIRTSEDFQGEGAPKWSWQDTILPKPGDEFAAEVERAFKELDPDRGIWGEYARPYTEQIITAAKDLIKRETGWMTRIHPLVLPSGRILIPLYSDGYNVGLMAISDDSGETWSAGKPLVGMGPIQPTVARKKDGTLVAYCRDSGSEPQRALVSTSKDDGQTWSSAVDSDVPNPGSSLEVIVLKDGRWVMILNDTEQGRHSLALWLSDDEGATWKWKRHLELTEPGQGSFAYPSLIEGSDGQLHMTYTHAVKEGKTIKHAAVGVEWIQKGD
ncbi:MAG: hypothetical protein GHCLOJNM_02725 [bacterium]|nr:hypothetical protein [bacterium]